MKLIKKKIKSDRVITDSIIGKWIKLTKIYLYEHYYETDEFYIVTYRVLPTAGLEYMIVRKDDNIIIKQDMQDMKLPKKIISLLEQF